MYQKLKIDFDKKENELLDSAALESDSIVKLIAEMKENNTSNDDIIASLDTYTQARVKTAANIARIDIDELIDIILYVSIKNYPTDFSEVGNSYGISRKIAIRDNFFSIRISQRFGGSS